MNPIPPEDVAADLLNASGQTEPPTDIGRVVRILRGLTVVVEPLDNDGYIFDVPGGAEILVNAQAGTSRQRFTLAHEIGHYALQVGLGEDSLLSNHAEIERWCDRFAVGLLMPQSWLKRFLRGTCETNLARRIAGGPRRFGVSPRAFWPRISEIVPILAFELTEDGRHSADVGLTDDVLRLARDCIAQAATETPSIAAEGLRVRCVRLGSTHTRGDRFLIVVSRDPFMVLPTSRSSSA